MYMYNCNYRYLYHGNNNLYEGKVSYDCFVFQLSTQSNHRILHSQTTLINTDDFLMSKTQQSVIGQCY